ncbi:MAG: hypothetical protein AMJ79_09455 [Phycisphaerae bacterium SM23_30]|nr:MAG: hypothetical protein AMJ79_09455 [Phycisphaerae bacterium SM23_30]
MAKSRSRKKIARKSPPDAKRRLEHRRRPQKPEQIQALTQKQQKRYEIIVILALLALGIYLSCLYFGHQAVPNPDFVAFVDTSNSLIDYLRTFFHEEPIKIKNFKRAPVLGLLQVGLGYFIRGLVPELTAGWLINAFLYPLTGLLLYLIAKKILGKGAVWFTILALINPLSLRLLRQPIAETTLRFFAILTIYLILRRSRWRYLTASVAAMIRYDGAALILVAFVMDMIESKTWRLRLMALLWSVLASVPLALWLRGMYLDHLADNIKNPERQSITRIEYINHYDIKNRNVLDEFSYYVWLESIGPLFGTLSELSDDAPPQPDRHTEVRFALISKLGTITKTMTFQFLIRPSQVLLVICLISAVGYGLYKKQREILLLLLFSVPYFLVHALRYGTQNRHVLALTWLVLLLCFYGLLNLWKIINRRVRLPKQLLIFLQIILLAVAVIWFIKMIYYIPEYPSPRSVSVPYVAIAALVLVLLAFAYTFRGKNLLPHVTASVLMCSLIATNQYKLIQYMETGATDQEFKSLAFWYLENAQPGEKLVTTMPHIVELFAPEHKNYFVKTSYIAGVTYDDFVQDCIKTNITYVAWDSRIGNLPNDPYYTRWKVGRIDVLRQPPFPKPFELIKTIPNDYFPNRIIHIFRFHPELVDKR